MGEFNSTVYPIIIVKMRYIKTHTAHFYNNYGIYDTVCAFDTPIHPTIYRSRARV